jgi:hypothetical protein
VNKKYLIAISIVLFLSLPLSAADIPQTLQQLGFTQYNLIDYKKVDEKEYFTFSDWTTEEKMDTIIFIVEVGKVIGKFKEEKRNNLNLNKDI